LKAISIAATGVCASGLPDWSSASRVLAGDEPFEAASVSKRPVDGLQSTERRRINETSRLACLAAQDALARLPRDAAVTMPAIFASSDGDGAVLMQTLTSLAQREIVVSPTAFHNSVYNAPAGYWSIATRSTAPSTTVCAERASLAVALLEGYAQATARDGPVLVVAVDVPFPDALRGLGPSAGAFACALVLDGAAATRAPRVDGWTIVKQPMITDATQAIDRAFEGNAAAAALPLLRALVRAQPTRAALPYVGGSWLELEVVPC